MLGENSLLRGQCVTGTGCPEKLVDTVTLEFFKAGLDGALDTLI